MDPNQSSTPTRTNQPQAASEQLKPTAILEPIQESISVGVPWYKRFFISGIRTETIWRLTFVLLLIVGFFIGRAMHNKQTITTHAGSIHARISLVPSLLHLPPDSFVQLWTTTDSTLTTGRFEVLFDPTKVTIVDAKPSADSGISDELIISPLSQVNTNGRLTIIFTQSKKNVHTLSGTFELVNITFRAKSAKANDSTDVNLTLQNTALFHDTTPFVISALSNTTILLNAK